MPEPNATQAVREGYAVAFAGNDTWYPNQQEGVLVYGVTLLKNHRELGMKFMRAFIRCRRMESLRSRLVLLNDSASGTSSAQWTRKCF